MSPEDRDFKPSRKKRVVDQKDGDGSDEVRGGGGVKWEREREGDRRGCQWEINIFSPVHPSIATYM